MESTHYSKSYFELIAEGSSQSAHEIIPVILTYLTPRSVVDIGCGIGSWLSAWKHYGIKDVLGTDGHYIHKDQLLITPEEFIACDLEKDLKLNRTFDLVTCLEVAEHIKPEKAGIFINSICQLGDIILFSAALPHQEGNLHLNEQYPDYWISLFAKRNFSPYDCLREKIWNNTNISWWYRQNTLFFIRDGAKEKYPEIVRGEKKVLPIVHPESLNYKQDKIFYYEKILKSPLNTMIYFGKKLLRKIRSLFKK